MLTLSLGSAFLPLLLTAAFQSQVTELVSRSTGGAAGNSASARPTVSGDGRFVAFESFASNLIPSDANNTYDILVRDRQLGTTEPVSVDANGAQANGPSHNPRISRDGRFVVFESDATNLVPGDTNGQTDVFVRDLLLGSTERVSVDSAGNEATGNSSTWLASITPEGRFVSYWSSTSNLAPGDTNGMRDVFLRDRWAGTTERVSLGQGGIEGNGHSDESSLSDDGRFVAFASRATNLVPGDTNMVADVFVRDRQSGTTARVSIGATGSQGNLQSFYPSISGDGRFVAFNSDATNLVAGDFNGGSDVFLRDRIAQTTVRLSIGLGGVQPNGFSDDPAISADGRFVAFDSTAHNLVPDDTNGSIDTFVCSVASGLIQRASVNSAGDQALGLNFGGQPSISADARYIAFYSGATNLDPADTNAFDDVFLRDRSAAGFTSQCDPGVDGVIACPCANAPVSSGRGCDNSSATGGATLAAMGVAYLSMDSLVFSTLNEKPVATSIVLQGNDVAGAGHVFGQGVRCVSGTLKRLYTKVASGGSITAPEFGTGDPAVSSRSATLGDLIQAGQRRWYLVYYRDPIVLGGCPTSSTFNATQTGRVAWSL